jgi:signal transduction histidine kinase
MEIADTSFLPINRGSQARQHRLPGLGLGLYVCKELIDAKRRIWLDDRISQGYANIFVFSLPLEESSVMKNTDS